MKENTGTESFTISVAESYRQPMNVTEIHLFGDSTAYPVCPRKRQTWDRVDRYERIVVERIEAFHHY